MAVGFWDSLGTGVVDLFRGIGGIAADVGRSLVPVVGAAVQQKVGQKLGVTVLPGGARIQQGFDAGAGLGGFDPRFLTPTGVVPMATLSGRRDTGLLAGQSALFGLDVPGVDFVAQGGASIMAPFRVTRAGNQVAQPFVSVRASGGMEWFIPAGKPTAWSKASIKRRHHHGHPRHHHPR